MLFFAHELVLYFHRDRNSAQFCAKVDIQKAYDSVSWDMVIGVLREMNFPERWL